MTSSPTATYPDLNGKTAIVTGASRGIGCDIARVLAAQGMRLALSARSAAKGEALAAELRATGAECAWVTSDCSSKEGARAVLDETLRRFGCPSVLVNNAAILGSKAFPELDEAAYALSFEKNVRLVYEISFLVAREMRRAKSGVIVNISSVGGLRAHRRNAGYDAAKGAVDSLTRAMALDLAPDRIRVNGLGVGAIRTWRHDAPEIAATLPERAAGIPLGRLGAGEEVANAVAFLASEASSYITGAILYIDGGLTAQLTPPNLWI